jgi:hypothetical protein
MIDEIRQILTPFNPREAISTKEAAERAGKSVGTIRNWCEWHGIGRQIAREWHVSRVALEMLLEGDDAALVLYHAGERNSETVARYFSQLGGPKTNCTNCTNAKIDRRGYLWNTEHIERAADDTGEACEPTKLALVRRR